MTRVVPLIAAAVLFVACAPGAPAPPSDSAARSARPSTDAPTVTSTPIGGSSASPMARSSQQPPLSLGPDVIAEVVTSDLVMRTAPGVSPQSIIYPGRLGPGDRLYLVDGPVSDDGFEWYLGSPYQARVNQEADSTSQAWLRFGWVAAADTTGEVWIVPVEPECPEDAAVPVLAGLPLEMRLACFGDGRMSLEGNVTCPDFGPPIPTPGPAWLTWDACYLVPSDAPPYDPMGSGQPFIAVHYPPGTDRSAGLLRLSGHFDDPRSTECMLSVPTPEGDVYSRDLYHRAQKLACRASFVVDRADPG